MPFYHNNVTPKSLLGFKRTSSPSQIHQSRPSSSESEDPPRRSSTNMDFLRQLGKDKGKRKASSEDLQLKQARLDLVIESPPLVSYGTDANSTGALMSGQLKLTALEDIKLKNFTLELVAQMRFAKPVSKDCPECQMQNNQLKKWTIITEPKTFDKGEHNSPFSYLLEGHLPATAHSALGSVDYVLKASALTFEGEKLFTTHTLELKRALFTPEFPRTAIRVFPPTNLKAECTHPLVIHPTGEFNVQLMLTGIITKNKDIITRWRLRRVMWMLEEHAEMISPACPKHSQKVGGEGKGIKHEKERTFGNGEVRDGWKNDWTLEGGGNCVLEFTCAPDPATKPVCDVKNPTGMEIKHRLMLELIIVEEIGSNKDLTRWNQTGSARVLRMSFSQLLTERMGMGISWDEEQPPVYEDVPESPPGYKYAPLEHCHSRDITGLDLDSP